VDLSYLHNYLTTGGSAVLAIGRYTNSYTEKRVARTAHMKNANTAMIHLHVLIEGTNDARPVMPPEVAVGKDGVEQFPSRHKSVAKGGTSLTIGAL
jgi:hypothetical protein